jgi:hypothetical protein
MELWHVCMPLSAAATQVAACSLQQLEVVPHPPAVLSRWAATSEVYTPSYGSALLC